MRYLYYILVLATTACTAPTSTNPAPAAPPTEAPSFFLGTYDDPGVHEPGIYRFTLQPDGSLTNEGRVAEASNPSFLSYNPDRTTLVSVEEVDGGGSVAAFAVNDTALTLNNRRPTSAPGPCHINVNRDGYVTAATYGGGTVELWKLEGAGMLSERLDVQDHRQRGAETPHAHSSYYINDGREVLAVDLGTDEVWHYALNEVNGKLVSASPPAVKLADGAGPRHLAIHPNGKWIYVINELGSTMTQLRLAGSSIDTVASWSTLPADFTDFNACADVHLSQDGRYLYGSNRGHNSMVVFAVDQATGALTTLEHESVAGDWPRNFALSPAGDYLLVANQRSKNITTLRRDADTGLLEYVTSTTAPVPVCILF
ncbi:lactonase family protein [Neolewinella sp.]|uniref:lactonase family protein n=1 Tax=Neolewinella sp. TaxID=2993543 RepID=UPI003B51BD80